MYVICAHCPLCASALSNNTLIILKRPAILTRRDVHPNDNHTVAIAHADHQPLRYLQNGTATEVSLNVTVKISISCHVRRLWGTDERQDYCEYVTVREVGAIGGVSDIVVCCPVKKCWI